MLVSVGDGAFLEDVESDGSVRSSRPDETLLECTKIPIRLSSSINNLPLSNARGGKLRRIRIVVWVFDSTSRLMILVKSDGSFQS